MIKIGFIIDTMSCDTAGTQKQLIEIVDRLDRNRFEPHLICLWHSPWMADRSLPCPVHVVGHTGFLKHDSAKAVMRLAGLLDATRFDIVQTFFVESIFAALLGVTFSRHKPVLLSSRRDIGLGAGEPWYHMLYRLALPVVNLRFDGIVANSAEVKRFVSQHEMVPASKIKVIRNGIRALDRFSPERFSRNGDGSVNIGLVGNLSPVKRVDIFLKALFLIKQSRPELKFRAFICGDGPEKGKLVSLAQSLGLASLVDFAGQVKNMDSYLRLLDIGVLCSDKEGLSNAILEYMAYGIPVVATAVGGNLELVDGRNGYCIRPGRPDALADALMELCRDKKLRLRLGEASFEKLMASYSWDRSIRELESYYMEIAGRKVFTSAHVNWEIPS
jgi:glycosyltransferase involved in cell wall biosynthesis